MYEAFCRRFRAFVGMTVTGMLMHIGAMVTKDAMKTPILDMRELFRPAMSAIGSTCPKTSMLIKAEVPCSTFQMCSGSAFVVSKRYPIIFLWDWRKICDVVSKALNVTATCTVRCDVGFREDISTRQCLCDNVTLVIERNKC